MNASRHRLLPALALCTVVAAGLAGCGGTKTTPAADKAGALPLRAGHHPGPALVAVADSKLGQILVDSHGRALYLFEKDRANRSECSGGCAAAWPVLHTMGMPKEGRDVPAGMLGMTRRGDGTDQVTYNRHPLYRYSGDTAAGQVRGQGLNQFGARWYVVAPNGNKIESGGH